MILAIDPGREKCGLAILDENKKAVEKQVVSREATLSILKDYCNKYAISALVIGKGAFGNKLGTEISQSGVSKNIIFIPEYNSTLEARKRYWKENPPKGLWRLIPPSLRFPPAPIDDYAAVILGERYLDS